MHTYGYPLVVRLQCRSVTLSPFSPTVDVGEISSLLDAMEENSDVEDVPTVAPLVPAPAEHSQNVSIRTSSRVPRATKRLIEEM